MKRLVFENDVVKSKVFTRVELFSPEFDDCVFDDCTFEHTEFHGGNVFDTLFSNC